ncbi:hypothetical protein [Streptomyces ureilyticus]|uniref:Uncharacterized protein n=1 Tax=Streptomyces ureilyticus TaxID=1775131 RepID=A0ABX0DSI9_9ACTN|nr:hypothetical protein [Streptomyces ureilyticus]NGO44860.1 hypothetical protein [Streptomyces ureilyticus]
MEPKNGATPTPSGREEDFPLSDKVEGPISAAIIAAGVGATALGLLTTLTEASTAVQDGLQWSDSVGPLSGKTVLAVIVWLLAWGVLYAVLHNKPFETVRALVISLVLIALGILGTFPPFFQLFA